MSDFTITCWGTRGSLPTPGRGTLKYGGNTTSFEIRCGDRIYLVDAGSGLNNLNRKIMAERPERLNFVFTHFHWDHIMGFPFFAPLYTPGFKIKLHGEAKLHQSFRTLLAGQLMDPYFPVTLDEMEGDIEFVQIRAGMKFGDGDLVIKAFRQNHPDGCIGYRFEYRGKALVFSTDTEHFSCPDPVVVEHARDADAFFYDCMYTDDEYAGKTGMSHTGWGHSTWSEGLNVAEAAGVKRFYMIHHDPGHDDGFLDAEEKKAQDRFKQSFLVAEGMTVEM